MQLIAPEKQPDFPADDITDSSAALLELLLQHQEGVETMHRQAEALNDLYQTLHPQLDTLAKDSFQNSSGEQAFSYGIGLFEVLSVLVTQEQEDTALPKRIMALAASQKLKHNFIVQISDERDRFREELPLAASVVVESSTRFHRGREDYVLCGAAALRKLVLDAVA